MWYALWSLPILIVGFYAGWHYNNVVRRVEDLSQSVKDFVREPKKEPKPKTVILDPDNVAQQARLEHDRIMRGLNPDEK